MNDDVLKEVAESTQRGLQSVKDFEDLVAFKKAAGFKTLGDADKIAANKRQLLQTANALKARGYDIDTTGLKPVV